VFLVGFTPDPVEQDWSTGTRRSAVKGGDPYPLCRYVLILDYLCRKKACANPAGSVGVRGSSPLQLHKINKAALANMQIGGLVCAYEPILVA
jgi:hypothetical protein